MERADLGRDGRTAIGLEQSEKSVCGAGIEGDVSEETMSARWDPVLADHAAVAETRDVITVEMVEDGMEEFGG